MAKRVRIPKVVVKHDISAKGKFRKTRTIQRFGRI
jgi:hypothetical protein